MTLCVTDRRRTQVNEEAYKEFSKEKKIERLKLYVGMPVIAVDNMKKRGICNSHQFTVANFDSNTEIALYNKDTKKNVTVPDTMFYKLFRWGWCETVRRWQGDEIDYEYNIVETDRMSRNDLNSAIGRTKSWDHIGVDPKERKSAYTWVNYKQSCVKLKTNNDMEEGWVYRWDDEKGKTFYIGRTTDLVAREAQHRAKPTNPEMAEALKHNCTMVVVEHWLCTPEQLDGRETRLIHDAQLNGTELLNIYKKQVEVLKEKTEVKHTVVITRFNIYDDMNKKRLRIRWVEGGKEHSRERRYDTRPYDAAYKEMETIRSELIKTYIA
jgi:hypothetical protein